MAGTYEVNGTQLEKFYHHWFTSDEYIIDLIKELNLSSKLKFLNSKTSIWYTNKFYKLSSPLDLLKFSAISFFDRIKLGILALKARKLIIGKN